MFKSICICQIHSDKRLLKSNYFQVHSLTLFSEKVKINPPNAEEASSQL